MIYLTENPTSVLEGPSQPGNVNYVEYCNELACLNNNCCEIVMGGNYGAAVGKI